MSETTPTRKTLLARPKRFLRLLWSVIDPRAWAHLIKIVNYYNYTHVQPMRKITLGPYEDTGGIAPNVSFTNPERIEIGARAAIGAQLPPVGRQWQRPDRDRGRCADGPRGPAGGLHLSHQ